MNRRLAAAGVMTGLFVAGAISGGAVVHVLEADPPSVSRGSDRDGSRDDDRRRRSPRSFTSERVIESLTERLELTPEQQDSLQAILEAQRSQANEVFQEMMPRLSTTVDSANALFRRILELDQQERFDALLRENRGVLGRPPPSGRGPSER